MLKNRDPAMVAYAIFAVVAALFYGAIILFLYVKDLHA